MYVPLQQLHACQPQLTRIKIADSSTESGHDSLEQWSFCSSRNRQNTTSKYHSNNLLASISQAIFFVQLVPDASELKVETTFWASSLLSLLLRSRDLSVPRSLTFKPLTPPFSARSSFTTEVLRHKFWPCLKNPPSRPMAAQHINMVSKSSLAPCFLYI